MADRLSAKEALFCQYYKILHSPREAAARAGYPFPERSALRLLKKEGVKREMEKQNSLLKPSAEEGLRRIAFGSIADAVYLATKEPPVTKEELESLDLFMVSELKFSKGGMDIKFYDRIKALDLLQSGETETVGGSAEPFYRALCEGAKNLSFMGEENGI